MLQAPIMFAFLRTAFCTILALNLIALQICMADNLSGIYGYRFYRASGTSPMMASGMAADFDTNAYVLGVFYTNTTINTTILTNAGGWPNIALIKFKFGLTNAPEWIRSPVTDYAFSNTRVGCNSAIYNFIGGSFCGADLTFDSTSITNYGNSAEHSDDIFLVGYDMYGNFRFLTQAGGTSKDTLGDMAVDAVGNSYLTGSFLSPTFSAGGSNLVRQSTSGGDCFTIKYDSSGNLLWMESGSYAQGTCIALDSTGNCYVGGTLSGPAVFDALSPSGQATTNFLAKYSSSGSLAWVRGDMCLGKFIRVDKAQCIYTVGTFSNIFQIGTISLSNNAAATIYIAKYDINGNVLWANQLSGFGNDNVSGIMIDDKTNCWVAGNFASVIAPTNPVAVVARFNSSGDLTAISQANPNQVSVASGTAMASFAGVIPIICGSYSTNLTLGRTSFTNSGNTDVFAAWCMISPAVTMSTRGSNVICSWPAADSVGYSLQTASDMSAANWSSAGAGSSVNGRVFVTNAISSGVRFYRLRHP